MSKARDEAFEEDRPRPRREPERRPREDEEDGEPRPRRRRADDDLDEPRSRRREADDDADEPRPRRRRRPRDDDDDDGISTLIPYKNGKALAAYYCGVFALIPCIGLVLGPLALVFGILGVRFAKENPKARGMGHAIAGIILGSLVLVGHLTILVLIGIGIATSRR